MASKNSAEESAVDLAARAGWMYYLGGMTQDQIAKALGTSRQRAQRLVAKASADGLIGVRLNHAVSACLELEEELKRQFGLEMARVAPSLPAGLDPLVSVAPVAAHELEKILSTPEKLVISLGTGRTLRKVVDELSTMECPQHKLVSLIGNAAQDGSATVYEVIMRLADRIGARHYPLALPLIAEDEEDRSFHLSMRHVQPALHLARTADLSIVGLGQIADTAPLVEDGFISEEDLAYLQRNGAVGELVGWAFNEAGAYLEGGTNARINGVRADSAGSPVICVAAGPSKYKALAAALAGRLISGLITDEASARHVLGM